LIFLLDYFQESAMKVFYAFFMGLFFSPNGESCANAFVSIFGMEKFHIEKEMSDSAAF